MNLEDAHLCNICNEFFLATETEKVQRHSQTPKNVPYPVGLILKGMDGSHYDERNSFLILFEDIISYDMQHNAKYKLRSFVPSEEYTMVRGLFDFVPNGRSSASIDTSIRNGEWIMLTEEEFNLHSDHIMKKLIAEKEEDEMRGIPSGITIPTFSKVYEKKDEILVPAGK